MPDGWLTEWTAQKIPIVQKLGKGECGGSYAEAIIILCSMLSAIAADVWPGRHKDKKRFVELLVKYSEETFGAKKISIPLLIGELRTSGYKNESEVLFKKFMSSCSTQVITGIEVDKYENDIISICPAVPIKTIRENSYTNILYQEVRSGYVHQYQPGERSDSWAMGSARGAGNIRYVNRVDKIDRLIHFDVNWLIAILRSVVVEIENSLPLVGDSAFKAWWLPNK